MVIHDMMDVVILESPFAGDVERNLRYARAAMRDCLKRGEAPFVSHALYTQPGVLDDDVPEERRLGMRAGFSFRAMAAKTVVYTNFGVSDGMMEGIVHAVDYDHDIEYRTLEGW